MPATLEVKKLPYTIKRDPDAVAEPTFQHPDRCMNCGHLKDKHESSVGCLEEGGTKYMEDDKGNAIRACSCLQFIPAPPKKKEE